MKKLFCGLFIFIVLVAVGFIGFWFWTEWAHDKSAIQYIKDRTQQEQVVEDTTIEDDAEDEVYSGEASTPAEDF